MIDVERTIISQYANSPIIVQLVQDMNAWIDQTANIDAFYNLVWNVDTAQGYGLDVWGRIVGVGRVVQVAASGLFGFEEATTLSANPFNQGIFYNGASTTSNYPLSDNAYRTLILAKALSNISDGSIGAINQILLNLFPGRGNCYCTDGLDMTMTYTFEFLITAVEDAIISQSGVLPRPSGVQSSIVVI